MFELWEHFLENVFAYLSMIFSFKMNVYFYGEHVVNFSDVEDVELHTLQEL